MTSPRARPGRVADLVTAVLAAVTTLVTLLAWHPFVSDTDGLLRATATALLVVALGGWLLRSLGVPWPLVPVGQAVLLLGWATRAWVPEQALGGWVPTVESVVALADEIGAGALAAQQYAAPVPADVPEIVLLLALAGAACAVLVDLFACTWRHAPLAGLPLLLVHTVPAGLIGAGVTWWVFGLGAIGYLTLLAREESGRLHRWGRPVVATAGTGSGWSRLLPGTAGSTSGRRIGAVTVAAALAVPLVVPVLDGGLPGGFGSGGSGDGSVEITNPMADLRRDLQRGQDVDMVRVVTDGPEPAYLRIAVLDDYDGEAWRPADRDIPRTQQADGPLPRPVGLGSRVPADSNDYALSTSPSFDSVWLPLPYPAAAARIEGDWRYDEVTLDVVSADDGQPTRDLDYTARSLVPRLSGADLAEASSPRRTVTSRYLELPEDLPEVVDLYAREAVGDATNRWEQAVRLQRWFQDPDRFTYDLQRAPSAADGDDLTRFLTPGPQGRIGYCEQFAASMALMARTLGIPARVAVGFLRPEPTGPETWTFSAHDMHAWPELYFEGYGWVLMEPTPVDRTASVPSYTRDGAFPDPGGPDAQPTAAPSAEPTAGLPSQAPQPGLEDDATDPTTAENGATTWPWVLVGLVALAALAVAPRILRDARTRRRFRRAADDRARAEAAWAELRDLVIDVGRRWEDGVSPRATGTRVRTLVYRPERDPRTYGPGGAAGAAEGADAVDRIVTAVEHARFAARPQPGDTLLEDIDAVRRGLVASIGERDARRARWWPRSLWTARPRPGGTGATDELPDEAGETMDRDDRAGAGVGR